jgi:hypothetical protein
MLGVAIACGWFFDGFSYCPFTVHFMPVERIEAGETVDSKNRQ